MGSNRASVVITTSKMFSCLYFLILCFFPIFGAQERKRFPKQGIFSVVRFDNDPCASASGSYNGTCLTSDECKLAGGTASGTCAESFGVCCVLTMGCGGTSSTNNTYLVQDSTNAAKTCSYTICPSNTDICKIRIDFETAVLSPASSTTGTVGLCTEDTLTVSSPGGTNPPLLCGTLTGHHLYLDASSSCHQMDTVISSTDTSTNRQWNIKVSQIECSSQMLPPGGCLQYFTGTSGYLYNFGRLSSTVDGASTSKHLANQDYTMCIRREEGYCSMEYFSKYDTSDQGFAVSAGTTGLFGSVDCTADYIQIPNLIAQNPTTPVSSTEALVTTLGDRICGNSWAVHPAGNAAQTYITFTTPYTVGVHFDGDETSTNENSAGFAILFTQKKCS